MWQYFSKGFGMFPFAFEAELYLLDLLISFCLLLHLLKIILMFIRSLLGNQAKKWMQVKIIEMLDM